jgi:glucose/mannose transport system permease protein
MRVKILSGITLAFFFTFVFAFALWNVVVSFLRWEGLFPTPNFFGLNNYVSLWGYSPFNVALINTLFLTVFFVPLTLFIAILIAILLDQIKGGVFFRTIYMLPFAIAPSAAGIMWSWMFNPSNGTINNLLRLLGFNANIYWIIDRSLVMYSIMLGLIWQTSGYVTLIILAGILSIPIVQIEASKIDGASTLRIYFSIILPQLKEAILTAWLFLMIFAVKVFDFIYTLTGGGPGIASYVLGILLYNTSFIGLDFGKGSAIATLMVLYALIFYLIPRKVRR